ncbi:MAG: ABC transporter ATP-binding protein [Anaerolineaceae bacterium]|nr:ABC transporter ATP-binding protein [Anaerolineaceae bacterium]
MKTVIETESLGKRYGEIIAVEGLSLRVSEGEIYAFLGLNGAGKTTTIRMLLGMIHPTAGVATVLGTRVRMGSVKPWAAVGYMVEDPHAYSELTVRENLEVAHRLHPGTPGKAVGEIIERLGLAAYADRRTGTLSHGNAQRLGLAKAMLHKPRLLILDEPANGLDPAGIVEIRELLQELTAGQGGTVFLSSHILAEVSRLAGRVGIIHQGCLLQEMDAASLERERNRRLLLNVRNTEPARQVLLAAGHPVITQMDGTLEVQDQAAIEKPEEINRLLVEAGFPPSRLTVVEEPLEEFFLRLVRTGENRHE